MERNTRQRAAIPDSIEHVGRPLLPQEVLEQAPQAVPGLSIAVDDHRLKLYGHCSDRARPRSGRPS